ncbi:MAG: hypothetical protein NT105_00940 [Verrucomicrobia bacterium]|nr:hypothetical protein [Verrucomicrobiota bacterium]
MKWIVFVALLAAPLAFAQTPSNKLDAYKKSSFEGKAFDTKTFTTKNFQTKEFETRQFETKALPAKANPMGGEHFAAKPFTSPTEKKVSWWKKLFGIRESGMNGKAVSSKSFATTGFETKAMPTKVDGKMQEKVDRVLDPKTLVMPNIKPTPEEMNKPVSSRPKSFPTASPKSP